MYNGSITANAVTPSVNMKNSIINGAMVIDQRNAGASVSTIAGDTFIVDRFNTYTTQASKLTGQQNAGSVTPPAGFNNYLGLTSTSAYSVGSGDIFTLFQNIEGYNVADLNWGTANAKTVTLSFWVRSSLTGTFGGSLLNGAQNRAYPFSYTISSANTWEQKSITVAGDTTGTWLTTNGRGLIVGLGLGNGSTFSGTAGAWTAGQIYSPTGSTSVVGTNGATFYITGVQLEVGSTATSFDYRPYGQELVNCQRYYEKGWFWAEGATNGGSQNVRSFQFSVQKRAAPTLSNGNLSGANNNLSSFAIEIGYAEYDPTYPQSGSLTAAGFRWVASGSGIQNATLRQWWVASSEL
jgi:hypothetical protein